MVAPSDDFRGAGRSALARSLGIALRVTIRKLSESNFASPVGASFVHVAQFSYLGGPSAQLHELGRAPYFPGLPVLYIQKE